MSVRDADHIKPKKSSSSPQPKWGILQAMNYVVLAVFVSSVTFAISSPKALLSPDEDNSSHFKSGKETLEKNIFFYMYTFLKSNVSFRAAAFCVDLDWLPCLLLRIFRYIVS
jgi:hypothetical protein